jgi:uncharacterized protein
MNDKIISLSTSFAQEKMNHLGSSHGWDHVERVLHIAGRIAAAEGADLFIVRVSAILHDIAREAEDKSSGRICHARLGAEMADEFLAAQGLDAARTAHISDCIRTHRFRNSESPSTIEAKALYDADKLDSIGAIGIGRAFLFSGEVGARLHNPDIDILSTSAYSREDTAFREFAVKLQHVKEKIFTREGKRLAEKRHDFMNRFFEELHDEVRGER